MSYFLGVILGVLWALSLSFSDIPSQNINKAVEVCSTNEGVYKIRGESIGVQTAYCKNGAKFKLKESK